MASSKTNREAFIASLLRFLSKWNFQGVDIDWEWPGAETRGGNPAIDKQNQVDLLKELREALGSRRLGVVLPAQYEYLKHLDPKTLETSVDFFNVLAYDLHGVSAHNLLNASMLTFHSLGMPQFPALVLSSSHTPTSRRLTPPSISFGSTTSLPRRSTLVLLTTVVDILSPT